MPPTPPTPAAPPLPSLLHSTLTQTIYERFNAAATAAFKIIFLLSTHVFRVSFFLFLQLFLVFLSIFCRLFALAWAILFSLLPLLLLLQKILLLIFIREKHFRFIPSGQSECKHTHLCIINFNIDMYLCTNKSVWKFLGFYF